MHINLIESHWHRYKSGQNHLTDFIGVEPSKKRKRRTSFTPQALELLNAHFERNTHPSGKILILAQKIILIQSNPNYFKCFLNFLW